MGNISFRQARKKYEEEILKAVQALPEEQLAKVVSLIETVQEEEKKKKQENQHKVIDKLRGTYKGLFSSVDEFMARKQEEKKLDR